jgi:hypothetical protein
VSIGGNQLFQDGNHRTALENMFDSLSHQGLSIRFDTKGNPEVDGFRLYVQLKSLTESTGKWPLDQPDRVKTEMVKLLMDVVRIRDVTWDERLRLARFVKVDIPLVLKQVDNLHTKLMGIVMDEGKVAAQEEYKKLKASDPLLYFRHYYLWGDIQWCIRRSG